jgi:phosphoribosyl 1,2-cyclic phosphodiesterase
MRFAALGSGSRGNATLVEGGSTRVLVDCGLPLRDLEQRLQGLGVEPDSIDAVLITNEHGDHLRGLSAFASRYPVTVWSTPGTWRAGGLPATGPAGLDLRLLLSHGGGFRIGDLRIAPYPIPHDAREPCQFVIEGDGRRLGILTDAGSITPRIRASLSDCEALMLEANHDPELLRIGPYPPSVRARVAGAYGHLSNQQSADLLDGLEHRELKHLLLAHISANNNTEQHVRAALAAVSEDLARRAMIAPQARCSGWLVL